MQRRQGGNLLGWLRCVAGFWLGWVGLAAIEARAQGTNAPTVLVTRPGQFEVVAADAATAGAILTAAREVWQVGDELRLLPGAFTTPVFVRAGPPSATEGGNESGARAELVSAQAEPGGVVTVRVQATPQLSLATLHRGLARGLLLRLAASQQGASDRLVVPAWLETVWAELAAQERDPELGERWPADTAGVAPWRVEVLLAGADEAVTTRVGLVQAVLLVRSLAEEGRRDGAFRAWVADVLAGVEVRVALERRFTGHWTDAAARELWWQVAYQAERATRATPWRSVGETKAWIAELSRFVVDESGGGPGLAGPAELWALRDDPMLRAELALRHETLLAQMAAMHPYYFNAARSLGLVFEALLAGKEKEFRAALAQMTADVAEGAALERDPPAAIELERVPKR